jgi:hypothetical protein
MLIDLVGELACHFKTLFPSLPQIHDHVLHALAALGLRQVSS